MTTSNPDRQDYWHLEDFEQVFFSSSRLGYHCGYKTTAMFYSSGDKDGEYARRNAIFVDLWLRTHQNIQPRAT